MASKLTKSVGKAEDKLKRYLESVAVMQGGKEVAWVKSLQPTKLSTVIRELETSEASAKAMHMFCLILIADVSYVRMFCLCLFVAVVR